ncbi:MAG: sulfate ABC transporter permease subunit CysT [Spirochaetes bacterium]|nr:sulfate ABC transporter permease subunit CysT [Spirochaetota bacterium]
MKKRHLLPGFGLTLGYTVSYLCIIVIIPLSLLLFRASGLGAKEFIAAALSPRVLASYRVSILTALAGASINVFAGFIVAWVLTRYRFPLRKLFDALIDLPFALPTAVAGISLAALFGPTGWIGSLLEGHGVHVINTPTGITIALIFIGFPFVVRTIQPVFEGLAVEIEEAAESLGANRFQIFLRVIFPTVLPALITGFTLAFARSIGEYGSVIFISGNLPMKTEITPLLIMSKLEQFDYAGAAAIATTLLAMSFLMLITINIVQRISAKRTSVRTTIVQRIH